MQMKYIKGEDYTGYGFDMEDDMERSPYWFFLSMHTAPGMPRVPMADWFYMNSCGLGWFYACEKLSLPFSTGLDFRSYNGYELFRHVWVNPDEVEKRTEKHKVALGEIIENYDTILADAKQELLDIYGRFKKFDYKNASYLELVHIVDDLMFAHRRMWEHHFYLMNGIAAAGLLFEDLCRELLGIETSDPLFLSLMSGFDNETIQIARDIYQFSQKAAQSKLKDIFLNNKPEAVIPKLETVAAGRKWVKELRDWLGENGWTMPVTEDYCTPTWIEDPSPVIRMIQMHLERGVSFEVDAARGKIVEEREKAEKEIISKLQPEQREWFKTLMVLAQKSNSFMEGHTFYCEPHVNAVTRYALLGIGARLASSGSIEKPDDTLFLTPMELRKALTDHYLSSVKATVRRRRAQWEENKKMENAPPQIITSLPPEKVTELLGKARVPIDATSLPGEAPARARLAKADIIGAPTSAGVAEGPARVILTEQQLSEVREGDILVAVATFPSWVSVFPLIKGVVAEMGGVSCHAAIISREYGIPCVAGTKVATTTIKTGDRIRIDGNLGAVWILK